jgi:leucine efflux protein
MFFESFGVVNIWVYLVGLFFIIIVPGPNSIYVLKTGASKGIRAGYKAAAGVFVGDAVLIFLAFLGVASLVKSSPLLFNAVRFMGAFYLLYLGVKIIYLTFFSGKNAEEKAVKAQDNIFRKSLALSITNPKAILFYISFFVQFIDFNYQHTGISYLILATILEVFSMIYLTVLIFCGATVARFFGERAKLAKLGNGIVGLFFMGFAAKLATLSS